MTICIDADVCPVTRIAERPAKEASGLIGVVYRTPGFISFLNTVYPEIHFIGNLSPVPQIILRYTV